MTMLHPRRMTWIVLASLLVIPTAARADLMFTVSLDTAPLVGHAAGPFSIEFQFNDGSGLGDANNSVVLSNFAFGGGGAVGVPTLFGGASGELATTVTLTDSDFFNQFIQEFTPGTSLSFTGLLTTNLDVGGTPDQFSFAILDSLGFEIPTLGTVNTFVTIDINSAAPPILTFPSDPTTPPAAGGPPIDIAMPQAQLVPEPTSFSLLAVGTLGLVVANGWNHRRRTANQGGVRSAELKSCSHVDPTLRGSKNTRHLNLLS